MKYATLYPLNQDPLSLRRCNPNNTYVLFNIVTQIFVGTSGHKTLVSRIFF